MASGERLWRPTARAQSLAICRGSTVLRATRRLPGRAAPLGTLLDVDRFSRANGTNGADLARLAAHAAFPDDNVAAYNRRMAARCLNEPIEPMTLGNMRANGVRS
jgi:hypothetical protein